MADLKTPSAPAETTEAQIAVHWKEEEYIRPSPPVHRAGQPDRPRGQRAVRGEELPGVLRGIRRPARLGPALAHDAGHEQPAVLEMVRRRQAQRLLQLRRPASGEVQEQGGADLRPRAGGRARVTRDLPGTVRAGQRGRGGAARLLRTEGRRSRDDPHADDSGAADHDAGVRAAGRHPLGRVRRIQRRGRAACAPRTRAAA